MCYASEKFIVAFCLNRQSINKYFRSLCKKLSNKTLLWITLYTRVPYLKTACKIIKMEYRSIRSTFLRAETVNQSNRRAINALWKFSGTFFTTFDGVTLKEKPSTLYAKGPTLNNGPLSSVGRRKLTFSQCRTKVVPKNGRFLPFYFLGILSTST